MAANFNQMLRAANLFGSPRPLGMPDMDDESVTAMMHRAMSGANEMKNRDLQRQKELLEFQNSLQMRNRPVGPVAGGPPNGIVPPRKNVVFGGVQPNNMLERMRQNSSPMAGQVPDNNRINAYLTQVSNPSEDQMQSYVKDINARQEKEATRTSAEKTAQARIDATAKAAEATRKFTAEQNDLNRKQKGQPFLMPDPKDPTGQKQIAVRWNPATETAEPITYEGKTISNLTKPGTKPQFVQPANLKNIRSKAQATIFEIENLLDQNGKLTPKGEAAFGWSSYLSSIPNTDAKSGRASVKQIQAAQILDIIEDMKKQSRTGATGFGAMNKDELYILENAASKLSDPSISDEDGAAELKKIREQLRLVLQNEQAQQPEPDGPGVTSTGKKPQLDADAMLEKYGR